MARQRKTHKKTQSKPLGSSREIAAMNTTASCREAGIRATTLTSKWAGFVNVTRDSQRQETATEEIKKRVRAAQSRRGKSERGGSKCSAGCRTLQEEARCRFRRCLGKSKGSRGQAKPEESAEAGGAPSGSTARRSRTKSTGVKRRRGPRAQKAVVGGHEDRRGDQVQSRVDVRSNGGQDDESNSQA